MDAGIPAKFKIDFGPYRRDLTRQAWGRMLAQFQGSPVMRQWVRALIEHGPQAAYDKILAWQEANTLFCAEGENLEAIGRIVGQPRVPYTYDETTWFWADRQGQGADQCPVWVRGASLEGREPATDPELRMLILARVACNMCRFSSAPEMSYLVDFAFARRAAWRRVGPMECEIYVESTVSRTQLNILTNTKNTTECDDIFYIPYPATLNLTRVVYTPRVPFIADRHKGHQCDAGKCALGRKT